jgi:hypothetical protein
MTIGVAFAAAPQPAKCFPSAFQPWDVIPRPAHKTKGKKREKKKAEVAVVSATVVVVDDDLEGKKLDDVT